MSCPLSGPVSLPVQGGLMTPVLFTSQGFYLVDHVLHSQRLVGAWH